ncbi:MAG: hypothetical protein LBF00_02755 [Mycoplasmataceae bacterium]|nr:hypothetical protein [Mycoplasmataceae bacterium]
MQRWQTHLIFNNQDEVKQWADNDNNYDVVNDSLSLSDITSDQLKDYFLLRHNLTDKNILNIIVYAFCYKILDGNKTPLKILKLKL